MFGNTVSGNIFNKFNYSLDNQKAKENKSFNSTYNKNMSETDRFVYSNKSKRNMNPFLSFGQKVVLTILDGFGISEKDPVKTGDATVLAKPKTIQAILKNCPNTKLEASGEAVDLPAGQMGNSEVGHNHIGAGRIVPQDLTRINHAVKDGTIFENKELINAMDHANKNNSALHIMGLVGTGGIHSHSDHLLAIIDMAKQQGVKDVYVHAYLDGRDTPPDSSKEFIPVIEDKLKENNYKPIATVIGRYYAMDRDKNWNRIQPAYNALVSGENDVKAESAMEAIKTSHEHKEMDEFVKPTVIGDEKSRIQDNDSVVFFNFRPDRARQITNAFTQEDFDGFKRGKKLDNLYYVCMTQYDEKMTLPIAFPPIKDIPNTLAEWVSKNGKKQMHVAETEKYAHVTFFLNGNTEKPFEGEEWKLIPSPKVATYDMYPSMRSVKVRNETVKAIKNKDKNFELVVVNIANPDMVGHTGNLKAAIKAVGATDRSVAKILKAAKEEDAIVVLTADHGNIEQMIDNDKKTGKPVSHTAHTTNLVPFAIIKPENIVLKDDGSLEIRKIDNDYNLKQGGSLVNVAPTVLELMELDKPKEMTGESLIIHDKK